MLTKYRVLCHILLGLTSQVIKEALSCYNLRMIPLFILFIISSFIIAFILAPLVIKSLYRLNIRKRGKLGLDEILQTHQEKIGVPLMGGLVVVIPTIMVTLLFNRSQITYVLLAVLIIAGLVGLIDDLLMVFGHSRLSVRVRNTVNPLVSHSDLSWLIYKNLLKPWNYVKGFFYSMGSVASGLHAHEKFILELLVAVPASFWLFYSAGRTGIWFPFAGELNIGYLFIPFAALVMVGFASAFGLTDGLDGLSGGTHIFAFASLGLISLFYGYFPIALFCATIVGTEIAFLYFNIYPARIEMADVGTVPLGMIFAFIGLLIGIEMLLPIIGAVFCLELFSSFIQVLYLRITGRRLLLMAPLHHHFERMGWPETKVTSRFWLFGGIVGLLGIYLSLV